MRKLKLLLTATALLLLGGISAWAQTDVTSMYLTNAGFEANPIFDGTSLGASGTNATPTEGSTLLTDAYNVYEISGWTLMTTTTSDFARTFTMPYNTTLYVRSNNANGGQAVAAPTNGSSVTESNNSLLFVEANWCQNAVLGVKQTATLPTGVYKLTFDTYVTTTIDNAMSLCGIKIGDVTTYKWPTAKDKWTTNEIYFTLSAATEVEFSMGYKKLGNVGGGSSAFLFVDNLKLVQIKNTAASAATDVTNKITNANASASWGSPWAHSGDLQNNVNMNNGYDGNKGFFEPSKWGSNSWGGTMYTDLTGLSNGLYFLKAAVQSADGVHTRLIAGTSNSSEYPANGTSNGTIASDGSVVAAGSGVDGWNFGSTTAWVTDGTLRIGVYTAAWAKQKWTNIDNFTLTYIPASEFLGLNDFKEMLTVAQGNAVAALANSDYNNVQGALRTNLTTYSTKEADEETIAAYETLLTEVNAALSDFTSAKASYDTYAAEVAIATNVGVTSFPSTPNTAEEALEAVKTLKVSEYTYVTTKYDTDGSALFIPSWEKDNFDALSNEHWSANTSEYFDKWSGSAFTSKIYKTVTLPEGHYAFYAAARGQEGASTATLKVSYNETNLSVPCTIKGNRGYGINTSGAADFSAGSTYACGNAGYGWEWRFITFDLAAETEVTLSIECSGNNSWVSAGDTKLLTYDNIVVNRQQYEAALAAAQGYQDDDMFDDDKTALNTVISDNTLTVNTATKAELITATANLNAAAEKAAADAARYTTYTTATTTINGGTDIDLTSLIGNPSFESTAAYALVAGGWVNEGVGIQGQTNSGFDGYRVGTVFAERWTGSGTIGAFKTYQTIEALPAGLYEVSVVATFNGNGASLIVNGETTPITDAGTYSLLVQVADKGSLELGVQAVSPTGSWFKADNFTLKYFSDFPAYTLANGKMGTDKSAAQTVAENTFNENKTVANYNALLTAIAEAEASKATYESLKTIIDVAEGEKEGTNFVTSAALTTFEEAIAGAKTAWENVTYTEQQASDAIGYIRWCISNYLGSTWITPDPKPEGWWYFNTWSTEGDTDGTDFFNPFFENFESDTKNLPANTFTAQLTGLENGCYEIEVWARVQRRTDADFNADNSMITMNVNGGDAVSLMSGQTTVGSGGSTMRLGRYTARGMVTDGTLTLTINVKLGANVHWLSWRDVKYTKVADDAITVSNAGYATYASDNDLDFTNVTGLNAYKATIDGTHITFTKVTTVPAGEGVMLKGDEGNYSVPVTIGVDAWADDDNAFVRGTDATVVSKDGSTYNYVLSSKNGNVGFYPASGKVVAKDKAYISTTFDAARLSFSFGDETTGIMNFTPALSEGEGVYDLQGRKVVQPTKGLYIQNGKKVIMK